MTLKAIFNEFKSQVAFTLALIWILAVWHFQTINSVFYPLFSVGLMTVLDMGLTWIRSRKVYWPSASFVTGLLIGLVIDPNAPIWIIAVAVLAAFLSKQFINTGLRQHIFNPAAFGIMTVTLAFGIPVAWWAVAWGKLPLVILMPAMIRILWRMKRLWLPVSFLFVYLVYYLTLFDPKTAFWSLFDGTLLLFALVMLSEPITSPSIKYFKFLFGAMVAILAIGLSLTIKPAEVFLPALLLANLVGFAFKKLSEKRTQVAVVSEKTQNQEKGNVS